MATRREMLIAFMQGVFLSLGVLVGITAAAVIFYTFFTLCQLWLGSTIAFAAAGSMFCALGAFIIMILKKVS